MKNSLAKLAFTSTILGLTGLASASPAPLDIHASLNKADGQIHRPRDAFTDGARIAERDAFTDGARIGQRDVFSDGAHADKK
nr:hypothetical protein [uncultured Cupriavidus sp.]